MRIAAKPPAQYPWYVRLLFGLQRRKYGEVLTPALLWGRSPRAFLAMSGLYGALERRGSPLEPVLRSLVIVRVSQVNACRFCVDVNSATLVERAGARDKVEALADWRASRLFSERERVALQYAEAMSASGAVPEELFERLRRHFDDDAIVELTALVAFQNLSTRFNSALDIPAQGFCARPQAAGPAPGQSRQRKVALVIADISGYTKFLQFHRTSLLHANEIISRLLEAVIDEASHPLVLNKLEGDAALLYAGLGEDEAAGARDVSRQIRSFFAAFRAMARELSGARASCPCEACTKILQLRLKVIAHYGTAVFNSIRQFEEMGGEDVILVHRLLKNTVEADEYVLMTEPFYRLAGELPGMRGAPREENCDLGRFEVRVFAPVA